MSNGKRTAPAGESPRPDYASARELVSRLAPLRSVHLFRPPFLHARAHQFLEAFPGEIGYAVRANPAAPVLQQMQAAGVRWFACDTLDEMDAVAAVNPEATFLFAHPIKPSVSLKAAYEKHRVRTFVLDHPDELAKLRQHTGPDATLLVRLNGPPGALLGEGYRYGCDIERGVWLAKAVVDAGYKLGLCFSLGSQVMDPTMFDEAFLIVREVMYRARFMIDMICVGGGFPTLYDGLTPPAPEEYFSIIKKGLARLHLPRTCRVLATPGRVLVNEAISILARVEQRRGQMLYLNDGSLGGLGSLTVPWWRPPVRLIRPHGRPPARDLERYAFSGPAGYGNDTLPGPFYLPEDTRTGDYIELGNLGAYAGSMRTVFNLAPEPLMVTVGDSPPEPATEAETPEDFHKPVANRTLTEDQGMEEGADNPAEYGQGYQGYNGDDAVLVDEVPPVPLRRPPRRKR